jgi:hypothetical protein
LWREIAPLSQLELNIVAISHPMKKEVIDADTTKEH